MGSPGSALRESFRRISLPRPPGQIGAGGPVRSARANSRRVNPILVPQGDARKRCINSLNAKIDELCTLGRIVEPGELSKFVFNLFARHSTTEGDVTEEDADGYLQVRDQQVAEEPDETYIKFMVARGPEVAAPIPWDMYGFIEVWCKKRYVEQVVHLIDRRLRSQTSCGQQVLTEREDCRLYMLEVEKFLVECYETGEDNTTLLDFLTASTSAATASATMATSATTSGRYYNGYSGYNDVYEYDYDINFSSNPQVVR